MQWLAGDDMGLDFFTKNLPRPVFQKHSHAFCGKDKYMKKTHDG